MAGARVEITKDTASPARKRAILKLQGEGRDLMLGHMGETLMRSTRERAARQVDPDGNKWRALSPGYKRWKDKKRPGVPILKFDFHMLGDRLSHQVVGSDLLVGTSAPYGAAHQFGGTFQRTQKPGKVRLRTDAKGNLLRQGDEGSASRLAIFASRRHKRFTEREFAGKDYTVTLPARPWLGVSKDDEKALLDIAEDHLGGAFEGK